MPIEISVNNPMDFRVGFSFRETSGLHIKYSREITAVNGKHDCNEKEMEKNREIDKEAQERFTKYVAHTSEGKLFKQFCYHLVSGGK